MSRRVLVALSIVLLITFAAAAQQRATREDGVIVLLHPDGRWELAPAVVVNPALGDVRVFFGNLHSHTGYSDGPALRRMRTRTHVTSPNCTSSP